MENILCPKCGSEHTEHISNGIPVQKASDCIDFEVHPFLYRCLDCGDVFPSDGFPMTELPDEV